MAQITSEALQTPTNTFAALSISNGSGTHDATKYSQYAKHQKSLGFQILAENYALISKLPYPASAIDVGCGSGDVTKLLGYFTNIIRIVGIDISNEMLAVADCFNEDGRISFAHANIEAFYTWPVGSEGAYNLATSFAVLHWCRDQPAALKNICRTLKSGGYFLAHLLAHRKLEGHMGFQQMLLEHPKWKQYNQKSDAEKKSPPDDLIWMNSKEPEKEYMKLLESAGFEVISCRCRKFNYYYTVDEMKGYVSSFALKRIGKLPEYLHEAYLADAFDAFTKEMPKTAEGDIIRTDERLIVVAKKK